MIFLNPNACPNCALIALVATSCYLQQITIHTMLSHWFPGLKFLMNIKLQEMETMQRLKESKALLITCCDRIRQ